MNLALFDIDGTLTESVAVDEVCFVQAFRDVLGIEDISTDWPGYAYQTDSGLALQIVRKHLGHDPSAGEIGLLQRRFLDLLRAAGVPEPGHRLGTGAPGPGRVPAAGAPDRRCRRTPTLLPTVRVFLKAGCATRITVLRAGSFMAAELVPRALEGVAGWVQYPPPFEQVPQVRPVCLDDQAEWLRMRAFLWPDCPAEQHAQEITAFAGTDASDRAEPFLAVAAFVAVRPAGGLCGFLEASIRPYAEDCDTWPVGYVEGWFVDADMRRQGVGRRLMAAAEQWAVAQGCRELASDTQMDNQVSLEAHRALGFKESSRAVHLRKRLTAGSGKTAERSGATRSLVLLVREETFAVCRLGSDASVPPWATAGGFCSISRTAEELSVVCRQEAVPEGVVCERGWRCLRAAGTMPFTVVGVLASLVTPLAEAGIGVFAISTFDTDYLLVKESDFEKAVAALRRAGHKVE